MWKAAFYFAVFVALVSWAAGGLDTTGDCFADFGSGQCNGGDAKCNEFCTNPGQGYANGICLDDGTCRCNALACTQSVIMGEPLYMTWDEGSFYAHSLVRHLAAKTISAKKNACHFKVFNTNKCQYADRDCSSIQNDWFGSYPNIVELHIYDRVLTVIINDRRERTLQVDGKAQDLPWTYESEDEDGKHYITVQRSASWYYDCPECAGIRIQTDCGLRILVTAGVRNVQVILPDVPLYQKNVIGALGLLDGDKANDLTMPNGKVIAPGGQSIDVTVGDDFLWSWRDGPHKGGKPKSGGKKRCRGLLARRMEAKCDTEMESVFKDCLVGPYMPRWIRTYYLDPNSPYRKYSWFERNRDYYLNVYLPRIQKLAAFLIRSYLDRLKGQCKMDFCLAEKPNDPIDNGACDTYEYMENQCRYYKEDADIGEWRSRKFCPLECGANQVFEQCAGCQKTCANTKGAKKKLLQASCGSGCDVSGCVCKNGGTSLCKLYRINDTNEFQLRSSTRMLLNSSYVLDEGNGKCVRSGRCSRG